LYGIFCLIAVIYYPLSGWHSTIHADFSPSIMEEYPNREHNKRHTETIWASVFIVQTDTN
jgi:hypothetical protein